MSLMPIDQALSQLLGSVSATDDEWVPIDDALGRILSRPVHAPAAYPFDDNSAMDGYALRTGPPLGNYR